jgi:hypothetical protein
MSVRAHVGCRCSGRGRGSRTPHLVLECPVIGRSFRRAAARLAEMTHANPKGYLPTGSTSYMATYTVIPRVDPIGFDVAVVGSDGARRTLLDFETWRDARAWDELDRARAVRPLKLERENGRTLPVLEDPDGEPLDGLLGAPMELGRFLRLAVCIATALGSAPPARGRPQGPKAWPYPGELR